MTSCKDVEKLLHATSIQAYLSGEPNTFVHARPLISLLVPKADTDANAKVKLVTLLAQEAFGMKSIDLDDNRPVQARASAAINCVLLL